MPRLQITLLGGFRARLGGGDVAPITLRKLQALLAYLVVPPGQAHPRDKLAALLWGDMGQKQARANLRQALAVLRRALGDSGALRLEGETVALDAAAVAVDVRAFEDGVGGATEGLADALALYQGDLLAGLAVQEAAFEEWLVTERDAMRPLVARGHHALGAAYTGMGDRAQGLDHVTRAVALYRAMGMAHWIDQAEAFSPDRPRVAASAPGAATP